MLKPSHAPCTHGPSHASRARTRAAPRRRLSRRRMSRRHRRRVAAAHPLAAARRLASSIDLGIALCRADSKVRCFALLSRRRPCRRDEPRRQIRWVVRRQSCRRADPLARFLFCTKGFVDSDLRVPDVCMCAFRVRIRRDRDIERLKMYICIHVHNAH